MAYAQVERSKKAASMGMAVVVNGSIIAAVMLSPLVVNTPTKSPRIIVHNIPDKPKVIDPVIEPQPKTDDQPMIEKIFTPTPPFTPVKPPEQGPTTTNVEPSGPPVGVGGTDTFGKGGGGEVGTREVAEVVIPQPIFISSKRDPKFARAFQPEYPSGLLVKEIEGDATIKVLVGIDGRVREALVVRASHPDFGKAAVKQALKSWRFIPATRGGQPVEDWQTIPIRFNINA
jgi:periplasmic protein TonB